MTLTVLLGRPDVGTVELAEHLDRLSAGDRVAECVALSAAQQRRLWEMVSGASHPGGALLPAGADGETATFVGRNSLPLLSRFEKRFARQGESVIGCNRHALGRLIGPGYFSVEPGPASGSLRFDYRQVPAAAPAGWPPVAPNSRLFARPVYGDLVDEVQWLSADAMVGAAYRAGVPLDSYFVLVRPPR